jgi:hypothetical protein
MISPAHDAGALLDATRASIFGLFSTLFGPFLPRLSALFPLTRLNKLMLSADDTKQVGQGWTLHHDTSPDSTYRTASARLNPENRAQVTALPK